MTTTADSIGTAGGTGSPDCTAGASAGQGTARSGRLAGMALMFGSGLSCQFGAATATMAFPVLGPVGVVAIRQWVAGAVLLTVGRPRLRSFTWPQWWPVLALAVVFATMNLSLYVAIDRVGLGLAVALEFLGPLAVALAASRRFLDLACALAAGAAVAVVARPQPTTDYLGIGLGLLAATCWACYILLNKVIGRRVPGAQGPAAAAGLSAILYVPVGIWVLCTHPVTLRALGFAATAGVPGRRAGPAARADRLLRGVHEREPGARGPHRAAGTRPAAAVGGVAGDNRDRERERAQRWDGGPRCRASGCGAQPAQSAPACIAPRAGPGRIRSASRTIGGGRACLGR
jgi:threonine/homoserine efflux transporter RhtA